MRAAELANQNATATAGGEGVEKPPCWKSTLIAIVGYRQSWSEVFPTFDGQLWKRGTRTAKDLWKVPQLRKSESVASGSFFLDDFHKLLGKHKTLSTLTTRSGAGSLNGEL
jgi:hypothetical protein